MRKDFKSQNEKLAVSNSKLKLNLEQNKNFRIWKNRKFVLINCFRLWIKQQQQQQQKKAIIILAAVIAKSQKNLSLSPKQNTKYDWLTWCMQIIHLHIIFFL